jgi:LMBR1 domain-containing protein 1
MLLAECTVLLLPLDIGNKSGAVGCGVWNSDCGGLDMALAWQVAYCTIAAMVVVVMPFFIFFYEADDEGAEALEKGAGCVEGLRIRFQSCKRSLLSAICYTLVCIILSFVGFIVLYKFIATTAIPYRLASASVSSVAFQPVGAPRALGTAGSPCPSGSTCPCGKTVGVCDQTPSTLSMDVTIIVFGAAFMSFIGWFLFSIYVGIGFVALPTDMINAFRLRPKLLSAAASRVQKTALKKRAEELIKVGEALAAEVYDAQDAARGGGAMRKAMRAHKEKLKPFRIAVDMLDKDMEDWQLGDPDSWRQHYNPLVPYAKLAGGVLAGVASLLWIVHIIIYMLFTPSLHPFLNEYLRLLDDFFPLFGTLTILFMGMYLLLAASKGAAKFGTRFFLISVHPLEPGKTLLTSFVFNVQLVLLCVLPTVQFTTEAFNTYARLTQASVIFGTQFRYIQGFRFFWQYNVFLFLILAFVLMALMYTVRWGAGWWGWWV